MTFAISRSALLALVCGTLIAAPASAGDWRWGCMGPFSDQQVLFSRNSLVISEAKLPLGKLDDLFRIDDLGAKFPDADGYNADDGNNGLQRMMTFTNQSNQKIKLTFVEKSSKQISFHKHMVCGRDELNSLERKTYHVRRTNDAPLDVTLMCREYLLTSRGGRPCISN